MLEPRTNPHRGRPSGAEAQYELRCFYVRAKARTLHFSPVPFISRPYPSFLAQISNAIALWSRSGRRPEHITFGSQQRSCSEKSLGLKLAQGFTILLQILDVISVVVDVPLFEKTIELEPRQPQYLACLIVRKCSRAVSLNRQRFQYVAPWIGVLGQIVGKLDRNLDGLRLAGMAREFYILSSRN